MSAIRETPERRYSTGRGTPALNPSSNTPHDREGDARRQLSGERRAESPEIDWPALVRRCLDGDSAAWTELVAGPAAPGLRALLSLYRFVPRRGRSDSGRLRQAVRQPAQLRCRQGQLPHLDHDPDAQPAGRSLSPLPPATGDRLDRRRLGTGPRRLPRRTPRRPAHHALSACSAQTSWNTWCRAPWPRCRRSCARR